MALDLKGHYCIASSWLRVTIKLMFIFLSSYYFRFKYVLTVIKLGVAGDKLGTLNT